MLESTEILVRTDKRRSQVASEPNYHITKHFSDNLMAIEMKKKQKQKQKQKKNKSKYE